MLRKAYRGFWLVAGTLLSAPPASAQVVVQPSPGTYTRAIAAGYKAALYCAGIFNAGRTPAQIDADELSGIYPQYDAIVPTLTAQVDRKFGVVTVAFDAALPARRATWASGRGCTTLPVGSDASDDRVPPPPPAGADPHAWPIGDAGIAPRPSAVMAAIVARAFDAATYGKGSNTVGVVVLRDGKVVAERYREGFGPFVSNRTWSVGKSIAGTLIGIATPAATSQPVRLAQWATAGDPRQSITMDHLLRMASGLHSDTAGNRTDAIYFGGTAVDEQAPFWPIEAPAGTRFRYANNDILLAMLATRQAIGDERYRTLPSTLFDALGMRHTIAETDWRGNFILSSQVWSTARDFARLGQFWLQDGMWQGRRLLPEGWVRYMTTPSGPQPAEGPGYGATLWLFGTKQGLPEGSYAAQGNRGQYVMILPAQRLVVVRRGEDPGPARFDIAAFARDIAAAR